jgi:peptide/nickel transport system substrate-binding protein
MSTRDDEKKGFLEKPVTRRQVLQGAVAVGAVAALGSTAAACGSSSSSSSSASPAAATSAAAGTPKTGGHLRVATSSGTAKEGLDAHAPALSSPALDFRYNLYDSLLEFDNTGKLAMALAESLEPNSDGTQYTVKLKSGLVFHDGSPVNADAVVYSFERIMDPKNPGLAAQQLRGLKPGATKKIDDLTVQFNLTEANSIFPESLSAYAAAVVPVGYNPKGGNGVVGTGPFKLANPADFQPGVQCVMAKNENYWRQGGGPYVDQLSIIEFADNSAQMNALLGGAVEYCNMIPGAQRKIAEGGGMKLLEADTGLWIPFTMNVQVKPFDDVRVRQAFRLIVDRTQLIAQAEDNMAAVGNDMYGRYDPGYPKDLPQRQQDLAQAKSLLQQAGQSGMTVKLMTSTSVASTAPSAATVFAQQAKGAGITVNVDNVTGDVFWGDQYLKWGFAMDQWGTRGYLAQAGMGTVPGALYDETHWASTRPDYMKLVNEAFKTVDDTKRNELITQAATMEYNDGAYIIYSFEKIVDAYSPKVAGSLPDFSGIGMSANCARYRTIYFV